jgi:hypothetical protein
MSDTDVRREAFITRQLAALRDLSLPPFLLAREEALLRGGMVPRSTPLLHKFLARGGRLSAFAVADPNVEKQRSAR